MHIDIVRAHRIIRVCLSAEGAGHVCLSGEGPDKGQCDVSMESADNCGFMSVSIEGNQLSVRVATTVILA